MSVETEVEDEIEGEEEEQTGSVDAEAIEPAEVIDESHPQWEQFERKWAEKVRRLEAACKEAEAAYNDAKKDAIALKKEFEAKVSELRRAITRGPSLQPELPFDDHEPKEEPQQTDIEARHAELMAMSVTEALMLTEAQREKLEDAGVKTVGDFERLRGGQMKDYPGGLSDLPRVGQATIDKWEEQLTDWLKRNQ